MSISVTASLLFAASCCASPGEPFATLPETVRMSAEGTPVSDAGADSLKTEIAPHQHPEMKEVTWSFAECLSRALEHSTELRKAYLQLLLSQNEVDAAKDEWLPTVDFGTQQGFINTPMPQGGQNANVYNSTYGINAAWTVYEGNARTYRRKAAELARTRSALTAEDITVETELGILQAYLNVLYNIEAVQIAEKTLETSDSQRERAYKLWQSGRSSQVDYAQIESQNAQDRYALVQAQGSYDTSIAALKKLLELELGTRLSVTVPDITDDAVLAPLPDAQGVFDYAVAWLPAFRSNDLTAQIYELDVKTAKAGRLPRISLSGNIGTGYNTGGSAGWGNQMKHGLNESLGLSLSVPIYDANSTRRAIEKAKLNAMTYELDNEELRENLSNTLENLYVEARSAKARYTAAQTQLEAAEINDRLVNRQFELGLLNPLELLTAHNNLLNARLSLLQAKYMAVLSDKTIGYYATKTVALP